MKKTKIVCTLGPASDTKETVTAMARAGMNVARLNFSHGKYEDHLRRIETVKQVRQEKNIPLAIMLDTKGPEFRIGDFSCGKIDLKEGDEFRFTSRKIDGNQSIVSVSFSGIEKDLSVGDKILLNNGLMVFRVIAIDGDEVVTTVEIGGELSSRKSMFIPDKEMTGVEFLSENDKNDLLFGIEHDVDFIALSFVSKAQDVIDAKNFLAENGGEHIDVIAKIENRAGVLNLEEIMKVCDGIMVARGDLGVEIPYEQVPDIQKKIITDCRIFGKRVITATEMLESMIQNPRPTRAEISDVANAVYDGTSAVMLSGESAAGKHPVEAVRNMAQICEYTEEHISYKERFLTAEFRIKNTLDAISHATCAMSIDVDAKAIVVCSVTGTTARMVSRFRSPVDIVGLTTDKKVWRKLALSWGVTPMLTEKFNSVDVMFYKAKEGARSALNLNPGDNVVLTAGPINGQCGNTNTIKVEQIGS